MDKAMAVLLVAVAQGLTWTDGGPWPGRLASAVAALSVGAIAWRRAFPLAGIAVLFGALAVDAGGAGHFTDAFVPAFAALLVLVFTVGQRRSALLAGAATAVVAAGLTTVQLLQPDPRYSAVSQAGFFGIAGLALPLAAGWATSVHRQRTAQLRAVREQIAASRASRLDRAAEQERARLARALDVFTAEDLGALERGVAAVRTRTDVAAVAALARTVLLRLRQAIGALHETPAEPAGPAEVGVLGRRVAELESVPGRPDPGPRTAEARSRFRPVYPVMALLVAAGIADVVAEVGWPQPPAALPVGLLLVVAPLPWLRRAPLLVTVAVCALVIAVAGLVTPVAPLLAGNLLLLLPYGCARFGGVRGAVGGVLCCAAAAVGIVAVTGAEIGNNDWPSTVLLLLAAAAIGLLVHREIRLAAELRTAAAELAAEQARAEELVRIGRRLEVARDLHDAVAHSLTVVALQAAAAARVWDDDAARAAEHLTALRATTTETLGELGRLAATLAAAPDGAPRQPGLADLPGLVERARAGGIDVALTVTGDASSVRPADQATAYRVVQECLTNAADHARGLPVTATVVAHGPAVTVTVTNPVLATVPAGPRPAGRGRGLANLAARVGDAGGELTAGTDADGRFTVTTTLGAPR